MHFRRNYLRRVINTLLFYCKYINSRRRKHDQDQRNTRKIKSQLKNISLHDLNLIDTDTGENITQEVIVALPEGTETVNFKITVELPE